MAIKQMKRLVNKGIYMGMDAAPELEIGIELEHMLSARMLKRDLLRSKRRESLNSACGSLSD